MVSEGHLYLGYDLPMHHFGVTSYKTEEAEMIVNQQNVSENSMYRQHTSLSL